MTYTKEQRDIMDRVKSLIFMGKMMIRIRPTGYRGTPPVDIPVAVLKLDLVVQPLNIAAMNDALDETQTKEVTEYLELVAAGVKTFVTSHNLTYLYDELNIDLSE